MSDDGIDLTIRNLPPGVTVKAKTLDDGRAMVTATMTLYGCSTADDGKTVNVLAAVDRAVASVKRYARWGCDIGRIIEVSPDIGIRIVWRARTGTVVARDHFKHEATVQWDDGTTSTLPYAWFAEDEMERVQ